METYHPQRSHERSAVTIPLQYRIPESDQLSITQLFNISKGGLYFETYRPMESNLKIEVLRTRLPDETHTPGAYVGHEAKIRWCCELQQHRRKRYGVGIQFLRETRVPSCLLNLEMPYRCDLCDRKISDEIICRTDLMAFLCPPCFKHLDTIPEGTVKKNIIRSLIGNVL
jgi:hypothetical protein